jgi:hypothetical protein
LNTVKFNLRALRGYIEHGWSKRIAERMNFHPNGMTFRVNGKINWKLEELNQVCRIINELGAEKYGEGWELVGVEEFLTFEDRPINQIPLPN